MDKRGAADIGRQAGKARDDPTRQAPMPAMSAMIGTSDIELYNGVRHYLLCFYDYKPIT